MSISLTARSRLATSERDSSSLRSPLRTPLPSSRHSQWIAVAGAFALRVSLIVLSHWANRSGRLHLPIIGREAGFIAWSLASGKGFSHAFPGYEAATAWLAPIFPALWAIGFKVFKPEHGQGALYFAQIMNSAFSALTCWPLYWLGRRLFSTKIALAAAWAWVVMPLAVLFPLEWAWDQTLSALVLALLLCATYAICDYPLKSAYWAGYALLWGFAALVNPTLCVLLPFMAGWVVYMRWQQGLRTMSVLPKTIFFFLLALAPWTARNYAVLDHVVFIKSNFGLELWLGNNPAIWNAGVISSDLHPMNNAGERMGLALSDEVPYMQQKQRAAIRFIRENPRLFAKLVLRRVVDTWAATYESRDDKWMAALHLQKAEIYFCTLFSGVAFAGLALALRKRTLELMPLAFCVIIFPIPYYITHTSLRYRHPIDPVLTLLAIYACAQFASGTEPPEPIEQERHVKVPDEEFASV